jgi:membrane-bound serine protease (ClpP class)
LVISADSIRTKILNSPIPVYVFIDNNAASAGALISIACDRIYMRPGANIGAATVVNQTGQSMPDKYQSYMRSTMRATAEAHGYDTIIKGTDTTYKWRRNPTMAEAMVDPDVYIAGVIDTGKVLTLTTSEAIANGFCEGEANSIQELIEKASLNPAVIKEYKPTGLDAVMGFFLNPIVQSLLIMAIFGGIYFELQTPGIGFPLILAATAAILYFAPLYLEGIAQNWEIALFIVGLVLIAVELFVIPGFGIIGISGIVTALLGLSLAMVESYEFEPGSLTHLVQALVKSLLLVTGSMLGSFIVSIYLSKRMFTSSVFGERIALTTEQTTSQGYIAVDARLGTLIGAIGVADTPLRPSGNINIDNHIYDAKSEFGFIDKGTQVTVTRFENSQLYVVKRSDIQTN